MQTFENGDPINASNLFNYAKIRWKIVIDLVLHKGNREKQTIFSIVI